MAQTTVAFSSAPKGATMKELETERLILRYFGPADIDPIHRLIYSDPEVYPFWGGQPRSREEVEERVILWMHAAQAGEFSNLAIVRKEDNQVIGFVALQAYVASWIRFAEAPTSPYNSIEVEVSYVLGRAYWGQGYAYEACQPLIDYAFRELRLRRLVNGIKPTNTRSVSLARRLGFQSVPNLSGDDAAPIWVLENTMI
jgi:RimJ/RimL family protein N-acetyltransferase